VLAPPLTQRGRPFGRNMWDQISEFLFDNYAVAGFQFENWMWVIGVPALLTFGYFFENQTSLFDVAFSQHLVTKRRSHG
jgi:hypothetical protein